MKRIVFTFCTCWLCSNAGLCLQLLEGVTKQSQPQKQLTFELSAVRDAKGMVAVNLKVPREGKLKLFLWPNLC